MPTLTRKTLTAALNDIGIVETTKFDDVTVTSDSESLTIGSVCVPKLGGDKELVPNTLFYENKNVSLSLTWYFFDYCTISRHSTISYYRDKFSYVAKLLLSYFSNCICWRNYFEVSGTDHIYC